MQRRQSLIRLTVLLVLFALPAWGKEGLLLVSQKADSSLAFYTLDGKLLARVPVGKHPHEMVLSPDGRYAYTTDNGTMLIEDIGQGNNTVSIVDLIVRRKVGEISLDKFYRPHGIAMDARGRRLLVTTENPDQLLVVDLASRKVIRTFDPAGKTPHIVTLGRDGHWVYLSNSRSDTVAAINLATGESIVIPVGERPEGSVLSKDGSELYVANNAAGSISVINTEKKRRIADIPTGQGPVRIALTPDGGTLVYALMKSRKVGLADTKTRKQVAEVPLGGAPVSLNLSPDGKLAFASAQEDDTIYIISVAERKIIREVKTAPKAGPDPVLQIEQ
jgi:YVTN family beta-propeller protein